MRIHDPRRSVLHYAYKLLSYRSRSEAEMVRRLRMKGFDEPSVSKAIIQLKESGFVDDRKLAASLRRYAEESKQLSITGTRRFLLQRGVPAEMINEVVGDIDELETAKKLVEKKVAAWRKQSLSRKGSQLDDTLIRKLYGILYRKGYPPEAIKKVLRRYTGKEDIV
ncbi:MAG: recombination regulator RecX [Nitrospirae bacterium]|nr:recombination regulator RecX [Nitrospirota bacterium]MCL5422681.1 recombination regulator RecX [Nitrospirota bacterium]